ncbi:MAG: hypothetical protein JOZ18_07420, partial [Chloroflexi bacterium]|nr:hypothetical protein [Chloroflexota bacterium]
MAWFKKPSDAPKKVTDAIPDATKNQLPYPSFFNKDGTARDVSKPVVREKEYQGTLPTQREFKGEKGAALEGDYKTKTAKEMKNKDYSTTKTAEEMEKKDYSTTKTAEEMEKKDYSTTKTAEEMEKKDYSTTKTAEEMEK